MKPKLILCLALVLSGVLFGCVSSMRRERSVYLESCQPPANLKPSGNFRPSSHENYFRQIYADADYEFGFMSYGATNVLVFSQTHHQWKRITQVSLANANLGHSPKTVSVYWDFLKNYQGKEHAPLPLRTNPDGASGYGIFPDKITFNARRSVYLLWFNSVDTMDNDPTVPTKLEIRKKDLDAIFKTK